MTKSNIKRAKKTIAQYMEAEAKEHIIYGSSCDDVCYHIGSVELNYGKPGVGKCILVVSGVTCKGTDWYPNGAPFIERNKIIFTYHVNPKNGDVDVTDWWVKYN